jgi:hypothetical protein
LLTYNSFKINKMVVINQCVVLSFRHCTNPHRWVVWWGEWQLRATSSRVPPDATTLYSAGNRGAPTSERLGAPDQDAVKGHVEPLGLNVVKINLTVFYRQLQFQHSAVRQYFIAQVLSV